MAILTQVDMVPWGLNEMSKYHKDHLKQHPFYPVWNSPPQSDLFWVPVPLNANEPAPPSPLLEMRSPSFCSPSNLLPL